MLRRADPPFLIGLHKHELLVARRRIDRTARTEGAKTTGSGGREIA